MTARHGNGPWTRTQARRIGAGARLATLALAATVAAAWGFGVPAPGSGPDPLPTAFEPRVPRAPEAATKPRAVDIQGLAFPLGLTHNAPVPPPVVELDPGEAPTETVAEAPPEPVGRVRYLGAATAGGDSAWAVVTIDDRQRVLQVGRVVSGVELLAVDDEAIRVKVDGRERRIELAPRSEKAGGVTVASAPRSATPERGAPSAPTTATAPGARGQATRGAVNASMFENLSPAERVQRLREMREQGLLDPGQGRTDNARRGQD